MRNQWERTTGKSEVDVFWRNQALAQVCAVCSPLRDWDFERNRDISLVSRVLGYAADSYVEPDF
jgi:hypothetical protein